MDVILLVRCGSFYNILEPDTDAALAVGLNPTRNANGKGIKCGFTATKAAFRHWAERFIGERALKASLSRRTRPLRESSSASDVFRNTLCALHVTSATCAQRKDIYSGASRNRSRMRRTSLEEGKSLAASDNSDVAPGKGSVSQYRSASFSGQQHIDVQLFDAMKSHPETPTIRTRTPPRRHDDPSTTPETLPHTYTHTNNTTTKKRGGRNYNNPSARAFHTQKGERPLPKAGADHIARHQITRRQSRKR